MPTEADLDKVDEEYRKMFSSPSLIGGLPRVLCGWSSRRASHESVSDPFLCLWIIAARSISQSTYHIEDFEV